MQTEIHMRRIRIEKIVLNIGCGTKTPVDNAKKVLESLTGCTAVISKAKKRSTFNVPKNKPIGCKVTIRKDTEAFLKRLLEAKEFRLAESNFDDSGNFAFGIHEYIEIPGMEYDPKTGILGMDVCVALERPGYGVKRRRLPGKIGPAHRIRREEAMEFVRSAFGVTIEGKSMTVEE